MGSYGTTPMGRGSQKNVWCVATCIGFLLLGSKDLMWAAPRQRLTMARQSSRPPSPQPVGVLLCYCLQVQDTRSQASVVDCLYECIRTCLTMGLSLPRRQPVLEQSL